MVLELDHVIGCNGQYSQTALFHPVQPHIVIYGLGAAVVVEDSRVRDARCEGGEVPESVAQEFLRHHDAPVCSLAVSDDGAYIASGQLGSPVKKGASALVCVWNFATKELVASFSGLGGQVLSLDISPDGRFVAASGANQVTYIWDTKTAEIILGKRTEQPCTLLLWAPILEALETRADREKTAVNTGCRLRTSAGFQSNSQELFGGRGYPSYCLAAFIGSELFLLNLDFEIANMAFQVRTSRGLVPGKGLHRKHLCGSFRAYPYLLSGTEQSELCVFRVTLEPAELTGHPSQVTAVFRAAIPVTTNGLTSMCLAGIVPPCESGDSPELQAYVGGGDGSLRLVVGRDASWEVVGVGRTGGVCGVEGAFGGGGREEGVCALQGCVGSLCLSAQTEGKPQEILACTSAGRMFRILPLKQDVGGGPCPASAMAVNVFAYAHTGKVTGLCAGRTGAAGKSSSDFACFASCSVTGEAIVWNLETLEVQLFTAAPTAKAQLSKKTGSTLKAFADCDGRGVVLPSVGTLGASCLALADDDRLMVVGFDDGVVRGYRVPFPPSAETLGGSLSEKTSHSRQLKESFNPHLPKLTARTRAAQAPPPTAPAPALPLWSIHDAHRGGPVSAVALPPATAPLDPGSQDLTNTAYLVSGGADGVVRVWNLRTLGLVSAWEGVHRKAVTGLWIDRQTERHRVHSCSADRVVAGFDVASGSKVAQHALVQSGGPLNDISQRLDHEQEIVTCGDDGRLLFWDHDFPEPVAELRPDASTDDPTAGSFGTNTLSLKASQQTQTTLSPPAMHKSHALANREAGTPVRLSAVAVSNCGRYIACGGSDARLYLFDLHGSCQIFGGLAHTGATGLTRVCWTADDRQLIAGYADGALAVWNFFGSM